LAAKPWDLSEADQLNGTEWYGVVSYFFHDTVQIGELYEGRPFEWSEWESQPQDSVKVDALLEKTNGNWTIIFLGNHYVSNPVLKTYMREVTCDDVAAPGKKQYLEDRVVPNPGFIPSSNDSERYSTEEPTEKLKTEGQLGGREKEWSEKIKRGASTPCENQCIELYKKRQIKEGLTFEECVKALCR